METGFVKKIINNKSVIVEIENMGNCNSCRGKSYCSIFKSKDNSIEANYDGVLKIGDHVKINVKEKNRIISSILIFFIPIIVLIAFYYIGFYFFKKEPYAIISSITIFLFYFIIMYVYSKSKKEMKNFKPFVNKI